MLGIGRRQIAAARRQCQQRADCFGQFSDELILRLAGQRDRINKFPEEAARELVRGPRATSLDKR